MREHLEKQCPRIKEFLKETKSRDYGGDEKTDKTQYLDGLDSMVNKASNKALEAFKKHKYKIKFGKPPSNYNKQDLIFVEWREEEDFFR